MRHYFFSCFRTCFISFLLSKLAFASVDQILNDNFYQNPAQLSIINQFQMVGGNVWINPVANFNGVAYGQAGMATSNVTDYLPYLLTTYRFTENLVFALNITPSAYGHLDWPINSIVSQASTQTDFRYYRYALQASYQINKDLAIGAGFNMEDSAKYQLNFVIPGQGNQINSVTGLNYTGDLGVYYKINSKNYLTVAGYTQVSTYGHGESYLGTEISNNLSLNITIAPVIYAGWGHFFNEGWFLEGRIYWSGWPIQKNINFTNTTTGTYTVPTNWKDVWSFQTTTRYPVMEKLAFLASIIYETNPVSLATNAIGYPLAASGAISGGVDITLQHDFSVQAIYSYGGFLPNSPINSSTSVGTVAAHFQAGVLQFIYKI